MALWQERGIDKLRNARHTLHAACGMTQSDQPMGLAAAVGGVEPEDRRDFTARSGQPPAHIVEQVLESPGGVGVGEEAYWIEVLRVPLAADDLGQVRREVGVGNIPLEDIDTWTARLVYRGNVHVARFTCCPIVDISRTALYRSINSRKLDPKASQSRSQTHRT